MRLIVVSMVVGGLCAALAAVILAHVLQVAA